jgi:hypothetical protein
MKTREDIITEMCYTVRHDYGLIKGSYDPLMSSGMTYNERDELFQQMAQIFDNNIAPHMSVNKD